MPDADEPIPLLEVLRPRRFARAELLDELSPAAAQAIEDETYAFLNRRFGTLAQDFNDISKTNFNPFLLLITAPVYNIFSPYEVAERLQLAKAYHGDDTAFGRLAEEKFLKVFGATTPAEKASGDVEQRSRWSPIDLQTTIDGQRYLFSIKAGPWTMNQAHANEMIRHFADLQAETGARIVIGVTYGRYRSLNNKPGLVDRSLGRPDWFEFLVGKDLWEFVSGVRDVHHHMFKAIRRGQRRFAAEHEDMTFHEHLKANVLKISASLRGQFNVTSDEDFWGTLFNAMFESKAGLPGEPEAVLPIVDVADET
jgi:Type II restriction endonuclease EcoO109I